MTDVAETERTLAVVGGFLDAVARRDVDAILARMSADSVYENFGQDVDAGRHEAMMRSGSAFARSLQRIPIVVRMPTSLRFG